MRVYWSGAAIALIADVELRERSGGTMSLDRVFDELSRSSLPSSRRWRALELLQTFDEIAGYDVFMRLYDAYVARPTFPDLAATFRALGFDESAGRPAAHQLRDSIMGGD
jgi:predicted metalloprotease with PDZ domain